METPSHLRNGVVPVVDVYVTFGSLVDMLIFLPRSLEVRIVNFHLGRYVFPCAALSLTEGKVLQKVVGFGSQRLLIVTAATTATAWIAAVVWGVAPCWWRDSRRPTTATGAGPTPRRKKAGHNPCRDESNGAKSPARN